MHELALQWGRGFSAAESSAARRSRRRQYGRFNGAAAFQPRKAAADRARAASTDAASMGPRLFSRGKRIATADDLGQRRHASMGPRLFSRGKSFRRDALRRRSRRFNGAAAFQPRKGWTPSRRRSTTASRFNGAAAFQPRKGVRRCVHTSWTSSGFNGAAAFQPRKAARPTTASATRLSGFNGAAAFQPRKAASRPVVRSRPTAELQWGRGFSAAESTGPRR